MQNFEIINRRTGEVTCGGSSNAERSCLTLLRLLRDGKCGDRALQRAFNRDGEACYLFRLLESPRQREQYEQADAERAARDKVLAKH